MKIFQRGEAKAPEEIAAEIAAKAARETAKLTAQAERRKALSGAGRKTMTAAVLLIRGTSWAVLIAAALVSIAGLWFDGLFYWQQSEVLAVQIGLLAFAVTIRVTSISVPVVLQWAKPDKSAEGAQTWRWPWEKRQDDATGGDKATLREVIAGNHVARLTLRLLCVGSILGCSVATLSFFSSGHEKQIAKVDAIAQTEQVKTGNIDEQIKAINDEIAEVRKDRDKAVDKLQSSIDGVLHDNVASNDGNADTYRADQQRERDEARDQIKTLNAQITTLRNGKQTAQETKVTDSAKNAPFLAVYRFLAKSKWQDEDGWTTTGALFFTALFECLIAFFLGAAYAVLIGVNGVVRWLEAREARNTMEWDAKIAAFESQARLEARKAEGERLRQETAFELDQLRAKAAEDEARAAADREISDLNRRIEEAKARAAAIAAGEDPEAYDDRKAAEKEKRKAQSDAEIAAIRVETERLRKLADEPLTPPDLTLDQRRAKKGGEANSFYGRASKIKGIPLPDRFAEDKLQ